MSDELWRKQSINLKGIDNFLVHFHKTAKNKQTKGFCEARGKILDRYWEDFKTVHLQLVKATADEDTSAMEYFVGDVYSATECLYAEHVGFLADKLYIDQSPPSTSSANPSPVAYNANAKSPFQLPSISLPIFTGKYNEWNSFRDMFLSIIDNNCSLTDVQKLQYLKTNVSGDAAGILTTSRCTNWCKLCCCLKLSQASL